jgi:plastocyanin
MKTLLLAMVVLLVFASGCVASTQQKTEQKIVIENFAFNPQNVTVSAGTIITWENKDSVTHDVTIDNGLFDHDLNPGETFSFTFNTTGTYAYHCDIHTSMKGQIIVEA